MPLTIEQVRARIGAQIERSSARVVARALGVNHTSVIQFATGAVDRPVGKNWQRMVDYAERLPAGPTEPPALSDVPVEAPSLALDALDLSGRLATFARGLLAAGGPVRAPSPVSDASVGTRAREAVDQAGEGSAARKPPQRVVARPRR